MELLKKRADLASTALQYFELGSGTSLLCLHPASGVRISPATEMLARRFRVYAPVLPGFDDTTPTAAIRSMQDLAGVVSEFIDVVIRQRPDVAGQSFGGWVACWLAVLHPNLVDRLILQCPAGFRSETKDGLEGDPATLLARAYAHPERRRPETKSQETIASNRRLANAYTGGGAWDEELVNRLGSIRSPTLIIHGRKDGVIPQESPLLLKRLIPQAELRWVEDAAHNIEVDQSEEYVQAVGSFLSSGRPEK